MALDKIHKYILLEKFAQFYATFRVCVGEIAINLTCNKDALLCNLDYL